MKVYTSYYGNLRKLNEARLYPIGISLGNFRYAQLSYIKMVAPKAYMLNDSLTREQYIQMYKTDVLAKITPSFFFDQLRRLSGGRDVALLCYEKPGDFCHRHLLGEWLSKNLGIEVKEFGQPEKPKEPQPEQQALF